MRRILLTAIASTTMLAVAPATSLAHQHRGRHHPRHARVEHFGSDASQTGANQSSSPSTDNAGTASSFSGGVLTIKLNDGSMVSGKVNGDTEMECKAPENAMNHDGGGGDGSGDNGSGDDSQGGSGDDNQQSTTTSQQSGDDQATENDNQNEAAENENEPAGEDQADNENNDNGENAQSCSTTNLTPGTVVREAELRVSSAGSTWKKVELITQ